MVLQFINSQRSLTCGIISRPTGDRSKDLRHGLLLHFQKGESQEYEQAVVEEEDDGIQYPAETDIANDEEDDEDP